jgi:hypothetical protein
MFDSERMKIYNLFCGMCVCYVRMFLPFAHFDGLSANGLRILDIISPVRVELV